MRFLAIAVAGLAFAAAPPLPAWAAQPGAAQAVEVSDAELKSFATAAAKVQRINEAYLPQLRRAASDDEQKRVRDIATAEMTRALNEEGMTVARFREIVEQARDNSALAERIRQEFREPQDR